MSERRVFQLVIKLIGVYFMASGVSTAAVMLSGTKFPNSWPSIQYLFFLALPALIQIGIGVYFVRGAPHIIKFAGYTKADAS